MGMRQRTGIIKMVRMPVMASFTPTLTSTLPYAYAFDAADGQGDPAHSSSARHRRRAARRAGDRHGAGVRRGHA